LRIELRAAVLVKTCQNRKKQTAPVVPQRAVSPSEAFKLRFWEIRPEALEILGSDYWKHSINSASSGLLAP
jgi:hypothetical protein